MRGRIRGSEGGEERRDQGERRTKRRKVTKVTATTLPRTPEEEGRFKIAQGLQAFKSAAKKAKSHDC